MASTYRSMIRQKKRKQVLTKLQRRISILKVRKNELLILKDELSKSFFCKIRCPCHQDIM